MKREVWDTWKEAEYNDERINADCNGAANILRKVATKLGLCLDGVSIGALSAPLKGLIWSHQKSQSL